MNIKDCSCCCNRWKFRFRRSGHHTDRRIGGKAVIVDLSEEKGAAVVEKLGSDNVLFTKADVSNEEDIKAALQQAVEKFGKINTVINCAGIGAAKKVFGQRRRP